MEVLEVYIDTCNSNKYLYYIFPDFGRFKLKIIHKTMVNPHLPLMEAALGEAKLEVRTYGIQQTLLQYQLRLWENTHLIIIAQEMMATQL